MDEQSLDGVAAEKTDAVMPLNNAQTDSPLSRLYMPATNTHQTVLFLLQQGVGDMDINISITENGVVTPQTVLLGRAGEHLVSKLIVSYPTTVNDIDISAISRYLNMGLKDGNVYTVPLVDISAGSSYVDLTSAMLAYSGKMQIMFTAHDAEPVGEPIFKSEIFFGLINRAIDGEDTIPEPVDNTGSVLLNNGSTWGVGAFEDSDTIEWTYDITTNSYTPSVIDGLYATAAQGALAETALQDATAFATAAQGTKADAALPATSYTADDVLTKLKNSRRHW